jgi:hypothetical protein
MIWRHTSSMRQLPILFAFAVIASQSSAAELPTAGKFDCVLGGQGACGDGPNAICSGNRVILGPPQIFLKLDLGKNTAELNKIGGRIQRASPGGWPTIDWVYKVMGSATVTFNQLGNGRTIVTLSNGHNTADFLCHAAH